MRRLYLVAAICVGTTLVVVIGWLTGSSIGEALANRSRDATARQRAQLTLKSSRSVSLGVRFPDLELWDPTGGDASSLSEILPEGGTILYVSPGCGSCLNASVAFDDWLESNSKSVVASIIVTDDIAATPAFAAALVDSSVDVRVFCDVRQSMAHDHRITLVPIYFEVKGVELVLVDAGVWQESVGFITSEGH